MFNSRMDLAHEIAANLRLKANAEIVKCTDNGLNTILRLRTDDNIIDVKIVLYDIKKAALSGEREKRLKG